MAELTANKEPSGACRMNAIAALRDEAQRLKAKALLLEKLADEVDGSLTSDAELALWSLVMASKH